ncbi:ABC transporter ATP-binding protein [Asticcacaulis machinosus]|uniref:ATP-binding cassette domain-containing protein n=1 Tax=Asticcacaulis machinosus TaxID=2984211 RepID=A0ABT5HEE1_9CAUL|nr:ATP-binding cassette domain-containing protein [Asticcacaulis machinosus]MDC7674532.1 ATP-binding cassette domain-containing protein [Asticcacaulis machinosus]
MSAYEPNMRDTSPPIEIRGLVNQFGDRVIHQDLDLTVERGKILGVVGGSGSGKTVLLKSILGLLRFKSGQINIFGQDIATASKKQKLDVQSRSGVLFQSGALFSSLTVLENIMVPMAEFTKLNRHEAKRIGLLKMSLAGLPLNAADLMPSELSGGMIKRAALARSLALDPELLFLDEPTAGLDPISAAAFDALIKELASSLGLTVFMITHDLDSLYTITDEVAVLADKHVVAKAPPLELEKSDHPWIHEYFHGPRGRLGGKMRDHTPSGDQES